MEGSPQRRSGPSFLLPARSQNALELRLLLNGAATLDSIAPTQAGLCGEPGHGLNQLIDLRAEQRLAIAGLQRFDLIGRAAIPVLHRDLI